MDQYLKKCFTTGVVKTDEDDNKLIAGVAAWFSEAEGDMRLSLVSELATLCSTADKLAVTALISCRLNDDVDSGEPGEGVAEQIFTEKGLAGEICSADYPARVTLQLLSKIKKGDSQSAKALTSVICKLKQWSQSDWKPGGDMYKAVFIVACSFGGPLAACGNRMCPEVVSSHFLASLRVYHVTIAIEIQVVFHGTQRSVIRSGDGCLHV
eukprot:m.820669 g.820669  ORF g.820669 m.820669 type:complete len:210 (-) comp23397_c0_seq4:282-911(-)